MFKSLCKSEILKAFRNDERGETLIGRPRDLDERVFVCASIRQWAFMVYTCLCRMYRRVCQGLYCRIPPLDINFPSATERRGDARIAVDKMSQRGSRGQFGHLCPESL